MQDIYEKLNITSPVSIVIISVAIILFSGFLMTRLTRLLRLPNVTAYIFAGVLIGPYCLKLVPQGVIDGMEFVSDIALAFIAFSVGEFFKVSSLRKNGKKVIVITLFEALGASIVVFLLSFVILRLSFSFSFTLSALASATAPASTMMTIRQTKAKGDFVETLLGVVALDDIVSLFLFSVATSVSAVGADTNVSALDILLPILYNLLMIGLGALLGFVMKLLLKKRSTDNRLIVSVAFLFLLCGIGSLLNVSPLLACMAMGMVYVNTSGDDKLFKQLNYFSPPVLLLFFVRSGMVFRIDLLIDMSMRLNGIPLLVIGIAYFATRILGKYGGAVAGCAVVKKDKKVRNYLGLALVPQAGVAIGLAAIAARIIGGEDGIILQTVILTSSVLYELIGPVLAKLSLYLSGSYGKEEPATEVISSETETPTTVLPSQEEKPEEESGHFEEEAAFTEAADEHCMMHGNNVR